MFIEPLAGLGRRGFASRIKKIARATRPPMPGGRPFKPPIPGGFTKYNPMPARYRRFAPAGLSGMPTKSGVEFLAWVKENEPLAWAAIVKRVPAAALAVQKAGPGMQGIGLGQDELVSEPSEGFDWGGLVSKAVQAGTGLLQLVQNQTVFKANLQRAQAGKPLITPSQVSQMQTPVRAAVGLDTDTRRMITLLAVGAGVLAVGGVGIMAFARRGPSHHRRHM